MNTLCCIALLLVVGSGFADAQRIMPRLPRSMGVDSLTPSALITTIILPQVNHDMLRLGDSLQGRSGRTGIAIAQIFNIGAVASYDTLPDGSRIGRMRFVSPGAVSQAFRFSAFYLAGGCELYIYDEVGAIVRGAFTAANNKPFGGLYFSSTAGASHVLELFEPSGSFGQSTLIADRIYQGYHTAQSLGITPPKRKSEAMQRSFGESEASCNFNVNCEGYDWCVEKYAVCLLEKADDSSTSICTGTLLNNSANNFTPYVLTAWHCLDRTRDCSISTNEQNIDNIAFVFNWWSVGCSNGTQSQANANVGNKVFSSGIIRALYRETDMALLEIRTESDGGEFSVPPTDMFYFAGWSRRDQLPTAGTILHHPKGDIMKGSIVMNDSITYPQYMFHSPSRGHRCNDGNYTITSADETTNYIGCYIHDGATEPGSSGSALLNENRLVVGQLSQNTEVYCWAQQDKGPQHNGFGKFSVSWAGGGTEPTRLSSWLAPATDPPMVLVGLMSNSQVQIYNRYTYLDEKQLDVSNPTMPISYYHAPYELHLGGGKTWATAPYGAINNHAFQFYHEYGGDICAGKRIVLRECLRVSPRDGANQRVRFHVGQPQCAIGENVFGTSVKIFFQGDAGYSNGTSCNTSTIVHGDHLERTNVSTIPLVAASPRMTLIPNPADGYVDIRISDGQPGRLTVMSTVGTSQYTPASGQSQAEAIWSARLDLSHLPAGVYYVSASTVGQTLTQPLIIIR